MAWQQSSKATSNSASKYTIQSATRGTSGDFGPVGNVFGPSDDYGTDFGLAVSAEDTAAIAIPGSDALRIAVRPSGSGFGPLKVLPGGYASDARVAFTTGDRAVATWLQTTATTGRAMATELSDDGSVTPAHPISAAGTKVLAGWGRAGLGIDDEGSGMAWWAIDPYTGTDPYHWASWPMQVATYDVVAPAFTRVTVPTAARIGQTITMGAPARDRWSGATVTWDFGDGGTEEGENLVYAYGKAGTYTVRVTATDGAGNARTSTRTITVSDGPRH
jgi:hypothetical protein